MTPSGSLGAPARGASAVAAALFVVGQIFASQFIGHPPENGDWSYDEVRHVHSWWTMHFYGGLGTALSLAGLAVALAVLCRATAPAIAVVGGTLQATGGLVFALGVAMEGVAFSYATDAQALPRAAGESLMAYLNDEPGRYLPAILIGQAIIALGWVVVLVALWRAGGVPRRLAPVLLVGLLAGVVFPFTTIERVAGIFLVSLPELVLVALAVRSAWVPQTLSLKAGEAITAP